jgi:translation elongation factor EF-1alpha
MNFFESHHHQMLLSLKIDVKHWSEKKYSSVVDIISMIDIDESPSNVTSNNDHHSPLPHYHGENLNTISSPITMIFEFMTW